jgi:hypothetical protein
MSSPSSPPSAAAVNCGEPRRAAIRYLHFIAGLPVPTAEAHVAATLAGIPDDLAGLRDRDLLLVGFAATNTSAQRGAVAVSATRSAAEGVVVGLVSMRRAVCRRRATTRAVFPSD